jgi:HKD family nuclease
MTKPVAHFELIENAGPNSVFATLKSLLSSAITVDVHVAFTTVSGLELLLPRLLNVATKGRVRFLTGLYQGCTEPKALKKLLQAHELHDERFQVRLSTETNFHRKALLVRSKSALHAVIGSSNFSANGLLSAGELSVLVSVGAKTAKAKATERVFARAWDDGAYLLRAHIDRYEASRMPPDARAISKASLKHVLGPTAKHTKAEGPSVNSSGGTPRKAKHWVDGIGGFVTEETKLVIADETNWDKNNWDWRTCSAGGYGPKDDVLLLDRSTRPTRWASLTRVAAVTRTARPTPDGRHFVAYTFVPRTSRRKITPQFVRELKKAGVTRTDGGRAVVAQKAWPEVRALFVRSRAK